MYPVNFSITIICITVQIIGQYQLKLHGTMIVLDITYFMKVQFLLHFYGRTYVK